MKKKGITILLLLVVAAVVVSIIFFLRKNDEDTTEAALAKAHYCFIAEDMADRQWQQIFEATKESAAEHGAWVECMNRDLPADYTREQLLEVAILADADGVFLEGGEGEELVALIDRAESEGIPVITIQRDAASSGRSCFVETGNYNLGREYARQIIGVTTKESRTILLVMSEEEPADNNLFLSGLQQTLANEGNHLDLDIQIESPEGGAFTSAQLIRRRVLSADKRPDVIVCFTDEDSINAHQVLVDYNYLDQIKLISSSTSSTILHAIEDGSLYASVVTDAANLGKNCVERMEEARRGELEIEHQALDATVIRRENVKRYLADA